MLKAYNVTDVTHDFEVEGQEFTSTRVRVDDVKAPLPGVEPLFFNSAEPRDAVVLSDIPGGGALSPRERAGLGAGLDESGRISEGTSNGYNALCLPMLAAAAYLWFVLHMLNLVPPPGLSLIW